MTAEEALLTYYKNSHQSQPELAIALNVSQTTIHNWLSGKNKIPIDYYVVISRLSEVDLVSLLPEEWKRSLAK